VESCLEIKLYQGMVELATASVEPAELTGTSVIGASVAVPLGRLPIDVRGRAQLLRSMREHRGLIVLTGMGGIGKSTVVAELARQIQAAGRPVWWVSAANQSTFAAGMVTVARQLGATEPDLNVLAMQAGDAPDRLWALLEQARDGWLLAVDNADDPALLAAREATVADGTGWVRASDRGLVVVTSRQADQETWGGQARVWPLLSLDDSDAAQVLLDLAPAAGGRAQAEALGRRLGGLPLALHLTGVYLRSHLTRWSTFADYERALDGERSAARLLTPDPGTAQAGDPRAAALSTWELSLDDLARHGLPHARAMLRLLSCFASAVPIPFDLLDPVPIAALLAPGAAAPEPGETDTRVDQTLRGLARLGLIDTTGQREVIVHPVVADANRAHLLGSSRSDTDPVLIWHTAAGLLARAFTVLDWTRASDWPRFAKLSPHLQAVFQVFESHLDPEHLTALVEAYRLLMIVHLQCGVLPASIDLKQPVPVHTSEFGEDQSTIYAFITADLRGRHASWADIEAAFREVLDAKLPLLGADHPEVISLRHNISRAVAAQGRVDEAETVAREVLDAKRRVLGDDHPETTTSLFNLFLIAARRARWEEAETIAQTLLGIQGRILGHAHPVLLLSSHTIAWVAAHRGRWAEAEGRFREVLAARRQMFGGDNHASTLATRHELAWTVANQGRWAEAEANFREIVDAVRLVLGDDHPATLAARHNLAWTVSQQGRRGDAASGFREVLDDKRRVLGEDHPVTGTTRRALESLG
jgi:hypothetical protein